MSEPQDTPTPPAAILDDFTLEAWTDTIAAGDVAPVRAMFQQIGAHGPSVIWNPQQDQLGQPQLRFLQRYWSELADGGEIPRAARIDPLVMRPALGNIILLDIIDGGRDFRYRLFGSALVAIAGFDMTGRLVSAHKAGPHLASFYMASCRAALRRGEPLLSEHGAARLMPAKVWRRLVLPLADANGVIMRFLVGSVPLSLDGTPLRKRF